MADEAFKNGPTTLYRDDRLSRPALSQRNTSGLERLEMATEEPHKRCGRARENPAALG
jgi:hypothetical protein